MNRQKQVKAFPGGRRKPFTEKQVERMIDMRREGFTLNDIAQIMDSSRTKVRNLTAAFAKEEKFSAKSRVAAPLGVQHA